ncbi:MAG TPA: ATP-binding protein [Pirellulaceae bacterium]|nr:ATP-binding protein [Pirellulaceae bacterium]
MDEIELLQRKLDRERRARKEAESLLEQKSRELFQSNEQQSLLADCLFEQAERIQSILDTAPEAILTLGRDGTIASVNPAAERIFGRPIAALVGSKVSDLIPELQAPDETQRLQAFVAKNHLDARESRARHADGTEFPIELIASELADDRGYTWMLRDVSRRRALEAQLAHALKMESVGALAAGIAHEINTPIQYVGDNTRFLDDAFGDLDALFEAIGKLLEESSGGRVSDDTLAAVRSAADAADLDYLRDEVPQAIRQSLEGTERVAKIVRAMKEFSHPGVEEKTAIDLNRAIESTVTVSRNEWKYVAEVATDLDPDLPLVRCLPGDLNQAVLNLVVNAAHAIEKRREVERNVDQLGHIAVSTRRVGDQVELRVADDGTGIPADVLPRIFDPFFTTKPVGKGTGQGLAITYSVVVEKHGGTIDVETESGRGTTFILRLPL